MFPLFFYCIITLKNDKKKANDLRVDFILPFLFLFYSWVKSQQVPVWALINISKMLEIQEKNATLRMWSHDHNSAYKKWNSHISHWVIFFLVCVIVTDELFVKVST